MKLQYTSNSANIAFYKVTNSLDYIEVLRHDDLSYHKFNRPPKPTSFHITICHFTGNGRVEQTFKYIPKTKPRPGNLPVRTVTRLVNAHLSQQESS